MPGVAELPLHWGRVPAWMMRVMERLGAAIIRAVVEIWGPEGVLRGLADPIWFQAFNNAIGMDWDSSGSTTVVMGVVKKVSWEEDLGFLVLGGKGARMRLVPREAPAAGERLGLDPDLLERFSRSAARVDSVFLQDGHELYQHYLVATRRGVLVVQQGMSPREGLARRYHVVEEGLERPHSAVAGVRRPLVLSALGAEAREHRRAILDVLGEGPRRVERLLWEAYRALRGPGGLDRFLERHEAGGAGGSGEGAVEGEVVRIYRPEPPGRRLVENLRRLAEDPPEGEGELLVKEGLGPRAFRALSLISHLIYRVPPSTRDPVTHRLNPFAYAYSVGGKDRVPYPFDARTAERVIVTLEEAVERARLGERDKLRALERLGRLAERVLGEE